MGNSQFWSRSHIKKESNSFSKTSRIKTQNKIVQSQSQYNSKQLTFTCQQQYQAIKKILLFIQSDQSILSMTNFVQAQFQAINNLCGTTYKVRCIYEQVTVKLNNQIQVRQQQSQYFEELDLLNILMTTSSILNTYQQITKQLLQQYRKQNKLNNFNFTAIETMLTFPYISSRTINILEDGSIIILNPLLYGKTQRCQNQINYYCSPQKLLENIISTESNHNKSLVFQLGITVLEATLLQNLNNLYYSSQVLQENQTTCSQFNAKVLHQKLNRLKKNQKYVTLHSLLQKMLQIQSQKRLGMEEVEELVSKILATQSYHQQYLSNMNIFNNENQSNVQLNQLHNENRDWIQNQKNVGLNYHNDEHTHHNSTKQKQRSKLTQYNYINGEINNAFTQQKYIQSKTIKQINMHNNLCQIDRPYSSNQKMTPLINFDNTSNHKQNQHMFTDPLLLKMIKEELEAIQFRKQNKQNKQNNSCAHNKQNLIKPTTINQFKFFKNKNAEQQGTQNKQQKYNINNTYSGSYQSKKYNFQNQKPNFNNQNEYSQLISDCVLTSMNQKFHNRNHNLVNKSKQKINQSFSHRSNRQSNGSLIDALMSHQMYF